MVSHHISESISWETPLAKPWGSASICGFSGDKKLEPLKYARVAMEASVSRRKVESCILGTTSLLHHCLDNGMSVAFILNDVGVLLIKGSTVQMRFYLDFLEKVMGHRIQDRATLKVSFLFPPCLGRPAVPQRCWMGTWGWGQGFWPGRSMAPPALPSLSSSPACLGHTEGVLAPFQALHQLDMVVSRQAPITSLSSTGRVVIFPK